MVRFVTVLLFAALCLVATVVADHDDHDHDNAHNAVQLGSFEGSFRVPNLNLNIYICQDGTSIEGYIFGLGIFEGNVDADGYFRGEIHLPGHGNCTQGRIQLEINSGGVDGFFFCDSAPGVTYLNADRVSPFRPTNDQCALQYKGATPVDLQGQWKDENGLLTNLCYRVTDDDNGDDDDETVQGSMQVLVNGAPKNQFVSGFHYDGGRIISATWYQDLKGGAILYWLAYDATVRYIYFTGLFKDNGDTFLLYSQINNADFHGYGKLTGPGEITFDLCTQNEVLQYYVLKNIPPNKRDDYYYFVPTIYIDEEDVQVRRPLPDSSSSSLTSIVALVAVVCALLL